jgi:aminoglycoside 2'-N-acetyltransferase I
MSAIELRHTAQIPSGELETVRRLLDEAFEGRFTAQDWDHALGGLHALVRAGGEVVGHGSLIQRRLLHRGRALRAGYVEGVAVRADRRRGGVASAIMTELERVARGAYEVAALSAADAGARLYLARGWRRWAGPTSALTPSGIVATPDEDGSVFVLPITTELDLDAELTCDWRDGDVW